MNVLFFLVAGFVLGTVVMRISNYIVNRVYNRAKFKVGDVLVPKTPTKLETWEKKYNICARVDEVGQHCYKLVYQLEGQDVGMATRPFYEVNLTLVKKQEDNKKPVLTLIKN